MTDTTRGGETLKAAVDLSLRYYSGLWRLATDYLQALGSLAVKGDAPAPAGARQTAPASMPPLLLAGRAGEEAVASFIVENTLGEQVTARLEVQASGPAARLVAQPETVVLGPGEQCVIQARVRIDGDMKVGEDCHGALAVPELASRTVPFVIRRLADAETPAKSGGMSAPGGIAAEGYLVQAMWTYASLVLRPAQAARRAGILPRSVQGAPPPPSERAGLGPRFSLELDGPLMLAEGTEHDHLVSEFDRMGEIYEAYVRPFSTPIMDEAIAELSRYMRPDWRLLDAGCGAGREACRMARLVPDGEVVGIDLAAGMVAAAFRSARAKGLDNTAFVQSDVGALPAMFDDQFDMTYSLLAHHHYPEPDAATRAIFKALRPGGLYAVIDPGPEWFNRLSSPLAAWADPGWMRFHNPDEFRALCALAGFVDCSWIGLLPGFGIAIARKPWRQ